ncbi:MAG: sigma-54-dependent Fis family transcriptional regulator, partial [Deltaproteobacteria bacterium]|nr:sigma-54-dependent Fis family transcriptional regulator [Deltaproteobacteria bacterium]
MRLLVIDDQKTTRDLFERFLSGVDVHTASGVREALGILDKNEVDIIVSDIRMDGMDGIEGLAVFREKYPEVPVIMMTAYATVEGAVEAMKRGAFDYIKKPFELDEMEVVINRAFAHSRLLRENRSLRSIVERLTAPDIVGESSKMKQALELAGRVAATDATVLILGESGTGKDLIAKYIHRSSNRIKNPFHSINC